MQIRVISARICGIRGDERRSGGEGEMEHRDSRLHLSLELFLSRGVSREKLFTETYRNGTHRGNYSVDELQRNCYTKFVIVVMQISRQLTK